MKKRGLKPTTRTWATLLSHFPKSLEQTPEKVLSRYTIVFDDAQAKIKQHIEQSVTETEVSEPALRQTGYKEASGQSTAKDRDEPDAFEDPQAVSNQYMQILAHFRNLEELMRVFNAMPRSGLGMPDRITYGIVLNAICERIRVKRNGRSRGLYEASAPEPEGQDGKTFAHIVWERLAEQHNSNADKQASRWQTGQHPNDRDMHHGNSVLDGQNAVLTIRALMEGSKDDLELAFVLLPRFYNLSRPGQSASAQSVAAEQMKLPTLLLDDRAVETILNVCQIAKRHQDAAHFARQFLEIPGVLAQFRPRQWQLVMAAFSHVHDTDMCQKIIEDFAPRSRQPSWPGLTYVYLFRSAMWNQDVERFLDLMEHHVDLPASYASSNARGRTPAEARHFQAQMALRADQSAQQTPHRILPTLEIAILMLETAIRAKKVSSLRQVLRISEVLKETDLIEAQRKQTMEEFDKSSARDRAHPRFPGQESVDEAKVRARVEFWRRKRYERLVEAIDIVLAARDTLEMGTSPAEQEKWQAMAHYIRNKLDTPAAPPPRKAPDQASQATVYPERTQKMDTQRSRSRLSQEERANVHTSEAARANPDYRRRQYNDERSTRPRFNSRDR